MGGSSLFSGRRARRDVKDGSRRFECCFSFLDDISHIDALPIIANGLPTGSDWSPLDFQDPFPAVPAGLLERMRIHG
jgi:hypothetical protein